MITRQHQSTQREQDAELREQGGLLAALSDLGRAFVAVELCVRGIALEVDRVQRGDRSILARENRGHVDSEAASVLRRAAEELRRCGGSDAVRAAVDDALHAHGKGPR